MKKTYTGLSHFAFQCINTGLSIIKVLITSKFGLQLPKAKSETCIIIGNGPSFTTSLREHPSFFQNQTLICVNLFAVSTEYTKLRPQYYMLVDEAFWRSQNQLIVDTLEAIKSKTEWPIQLFVPQFAAKSEQIKDLCRENKNIQLQHFNYTVFKGFTGISHFFYRKNLAMPQSQNILVASLFLMIGVGFKNIYFVGADHTWLQNLHVNDDNVLCIKDVHFYNNEERTKFVPWKKGIDSTETFKVHEILSTLAKTFYGYEVIKTYAESCGCNIYNASEVSFIDSFKRVKI